MTTGENLKIKHKEKLNRNMSAYSITDISASTDRHKLYILLSSPDKLSACIAFIQKQNITPVNVGHELALYINELDDYSYLGIDVYDFIRQLLDSKKDKIKGLGNEIVAIYNLGILLEPRLELNAVQLLKDFSKSTALILIWEHHVEQSGLLNWPTQKHSYFFNFSDTPLKKIQHAV